MPHPHIHYAPGVPHLLFPLLGFLIVHWCTHAHKLFNVGFCPRLSPDCDSVVCLCFRLTQPSQCVTLGNSLIVATDEQFYPISPFCSARFGSVVGPSLFCAPSPFPFPLMCMQPLIATTCLSWHGFVLLCRVGPCM